MGDTNGGRRVAVVSGGTRGIGRATVARLCDAGYDLSFSYRNSTEEAAELVRILSSKGARVRSAQVDMTDLGGVREWIDDIEDTIGPIMTVVCNAGVTQDGPLATMDGADWARVIDTNLTGVFNLCRCVAFPMMKRRLGAIVTMSSVVARTGNPGQVNYAASKAGIVGLTLSLAKELGRFGIRVNAVLPGAIETDMTKVVDETRQKELERLIALRRFGASQEVAEVVEFLASERASYVTGAMLEVSGGMSL
ncbi:MAG: SDR family NAD(P)-dependent oxidoreductase [Propionibacteriaceae bacterium]|nr:SDR family NAD(P)-dependent oxidoreductase [Propionibacteriaceae bacterium]